MAKIIFANNGKEAEVKNNEPIKKACQEFGIPFGCEDGVCGTCLIEIIGGENNLSDLNQKEKDLGLDRKNRLGCQCKIKQGEIKIKW